MAHPPIYERHMKRRMSPDEIAVLRTLAINDNSPDVMLRTVSLPPQVSLAMSSAIAKIATLQTFLWLSANDTLPWSERRAYLDEGLRAIRHDLSHALVAELQPVVEVSGE
jgi:hypothetical protein